MTDYNDVPKAFVSLFTSAVLECPVDAMNGHDRIHMNVFRHPRIITTAYDMWANMHAVAKNLQKKPKFYWGTDIVQGDWRSRLAMAINAQFAWRREYEWWDNGVKVAGFQGIDATNECFDHPALDALFNHPDENLRDIKL